MVLFRDGDAAAGVGEGYLNVLGMRWPIGGAEHDLAALRCKLEGIVEEVGDNLSDSGFVDGNVGQAGINVLKDADILGGGTVLDAEDGSLQ